MPSLPVASSSFRLIRPPAAATSPCRLQPPSLFRDAQSAWRSLSPAGKNFWDYNTYFGFLSDRLGQGHEVQDRNAFFKFYMLLAGHGALSHFDLEKLFIIQGLNFLRFRSLSVNLHYSGYFVFTLTAFIPEYWGETSVDSLLFFSHAAVLSTVRSRFRGSLPHKQHIGFGGFGHREFTFDFLSDYKPNPYAPARIFFKIEALDTWFYTYDDPPPTYLYFSRISKGFVDYAGA